MRNKKVIIACILVLVTVLFSVACAKKEEAKEEDTKAEIKEEKKEESKEESKKEEEETERVAASYENEVIECKENKNGEMECYIEGTNEKIELGELSDKDKELTGKELLLKYAPTNGYQSMVVNSSIQLPDMEQKAQSTYYWLPNKARSETDYGSFTSTTISFSDRDGYVWDPRIGEIESVPAFPKINNLLFYNGFEDDFSNIKMTTYHEKPAIYAEYVEDSKVVAKLWFNLKPFYVLEDIAYYDYEFETRKTTSIRINGEINEDLFEKDSINTDQ